MFVFGICIYLLPLLYASKLSVHPESERRARSSCNNLAELGH